MNITKITIADKSYTYVTQRPITLIRWDTVDIEVGSIVTTHKTVKNKRIVHYKFVVTAISYSLDDNCLILSVRRLH